MSKKVGRPKVPKKEAKNVYRGAFFAPDELKAIEQARKASGFDKSKWMRGAINQEAIRPPIWMKETKWKGEELDGQYIRFDLKSPNRELAGVGKLAVRKNPFGQIAVDIFIDECFVPGRGVLTRIWLAEDAVQKIELNRAEDADKIKFSLAG
jgi:hypothetical protein